MQIIEFLQKLKEEKGSTEKAAREVGCSRQTYENWLRGAVPSDVYLNVLRKIAKRSHYERPHD